MKIFAVKNSVSSSDFALEEDFENSGSNAHSGGLVVLAETMEEAQAFMTGNTGTLTEVPLDKAGIVLDCDGDC